VRYKNWKFYYTMVGDCANCGLMDANTYHWTQIANIKRDPFEISVGDDVKSLISYGGALAAPSTAYLYDWNILPILGLDSLAARWARRRATRSIAAAV
jgi:hypothetical protein